MTDRIEKALSRMSLKDRKKVKGLLSRIRDGKVERLDIQKLQGREDVYRVRTGDWRVFFYKYSDGRISVLGVERRSDTTYSSFKFS